MRADCPNDGPFDAEPEVRETQPVRVRHRTEEQKVVAREATTGDPVVIVDERLVAYVEPLPGEAPREVRVCVCPTCGSPIVVPNPDD